MKSWYEIYRDRMNETYRQRLTVRYAPFLKELHETKAEIFTEIGCGAGNITRLLREMSDRKAYHCLTDSCTKMLGLAVENNPVPSCIFTCADIRKWVPSNCDVVHSHGLLEHFEDLDIMRIVSNMMNAAPVQLHYVPGAKYEVPSRGDERLLDPDQWKKILSKFSSRVSISTFNDDFDIILRVER